MWPNYQKHSMEFFKTVFKDSALKDETYLFYQAEKYVFKNSDFKYKDFVEAGTLLSVLEEKGYTKFLGYASNHAEKYTLTDDGCKYLDSLK